VRVVDVSVTAARARRWSSRWYCMTKAPRFEPSKSVPWRRGRWA